jgi:hypothetical protein
VRAQYVLRTAAEAFARAQCNGTLAVVPKRVELAAQPIPAGKVAVGVVGQRREQEVLVRHGLPTEVTVVL